MIEPLRRDQQEQAQKVDFMIGDRRVEINVTMSPYFKALAHFHNMQGKARSAAAF